MKDILKKWWLWVIVIGVVGVGVGAGWFARLVTENVASIRDTGRPVDITLANGATAETGSVIVPKDTVLFTDADPSVGAKDAPLTIVEFGDFECPFCRETFPVIRRLVNEYQDKVRFVWRDFPVIDVHPNAMNAAQAAACAGDQGRFWEYHDILFINQERLTDADLLNYARRTGLDTAAFTTCKNTKVHEQDIIGEYNRGLELGVHGTPTFFFNNVKIEGVLPEEILRTIIDAFLTAAESPEAGMKPSS